MNVRFRRGAILATLTGSLVALLIGSAGAATPTSGTVGPASGSSASVDFAAVGPGAGSAGTIESKCAPALCDSYALTVTLPQADGGFYQTHKATLHIDYTW